MLLLREERLPELRLLPLALGLLLLRLELEELRVLRPLEAVPRLEPLLLREDEEPDLEDEEELRDAIACSLICVDTTADRFGHNGQSRQTWRGACRYAQCFRVGIALPAAPHSLSSAAL